MSKNIERPADDKPATSSRRLLLKTTLASMAAVGAGGIANLAKAQPFAASSQDLDVEILNFALNLEYLEAEYYTRAVHGHGLQMDDTTGTGHRGSVTGGAKVQFSSSAIYAYASDIANDERNHVEFLREALGSSRVAEPPIDLKNSFNILAQAAGLGSSFDPFANENNFLLGAFVFEDVGVTAYHGAATLITNKTYLDKAAGILSVEAYHAGIVRLLCYQGGLSDQADKISALRNKLSEQAGSSGTTDVGITTNGAVTLVPADSNSIAFDRNTSEVLNIVYAGGKSNDYGFFPDRMNGAIR